MKSIGIFYGSTTGNTETVAKRIKSKLEGKYSISLIDVSKAKAEDVDAYNNLILGTSTWGLGDLQDDWESFLPKLKQANLDGKTIALFGVGDSGSYPDTFVDGMGIIYESLSGKACKFTGFSDPSDYSFDDSKSVVNDRFIGLPLDVDNEDSLTEARIDRWIEKIENEIS